jgi:hypothetical protein
MIDSMGNYEIREIDINNERSEIEIIDLVNEVFSLNFGKEKIFLNTSTRNKRTVYLGAYFNDELVALNILISHELLYNNETVIAYQSTWGATSEKHRKKGLLSMLITKAKEMLDGAFIFGFPNGNSGPIFLNKLGFRKIELSKLNIPVKFFPGLFFKYYLKSVPSDYQFNVKDCFIPIESELIDLKTQEYQDEIKVFGSYNNIVWGKIKKTQTRIGNLTFFCIGGIQVNKPHLLPLVFKEIVRKEDIDIIQIVSSSNSSLWDLFKTKKTAPNTEPLIVYDLNINTTGSKFNFTTGIKDVF